MWWGFSEALDILDELSKESGKTVHNVLLIGQYDGRHILKTIAQKYKHEEDQNINFYIFEPLVENIAKQLLIITTALDPKERVGLGEKTLFFMELYGNTLIRPATERYLRKASKCLLNVITNSEYGEMILPNISLNHLKYKEKDQLEIIFKYWAAFDDSFDIVTAWNERLRKDLGVRYDSRSGVFDWDYHMRYHCYDADILKPQEYKRFRERGIAFYFEDTDPCIANKTLASAIFASGSKILSHGYMGDIITGPYATFGFKCDDKDMFRKVNGQMIKSATIITERNIMRIFHEIQHKNAFIPSADNELNCYSVILKDTSDTLKILQCPIAEPSQRGLKNSFDIYESLSTNNCKIIFLSTTAMKDYPSKPEFQNFFDLVFISQNMALRILKSEFFTMLKRNCKIIIETPKFLLKYRKSDLDAFKNDLECLMKNNECVLVGTYNPEKEELVHFIFKKL